MIKESHAWLPHSVAFQWHLILRIRQKSATNRKMNGAYFGISLVSFGIYFLYGKWTDGRWLIVKYLGHEEWRSEGSLTDH